MNSVASRAVDAFCAQSASLEAIDQLIQILAPSFDPTQPNRPLFDATHKEALTFLRARGWHEAAVDFMLSSETHWPLTLAWCKHFEITILDKIAGRFLPNRIEKLKFFAKHYPEDFQLQGAYALIWGDVSGTLASDLLEAGLDIKAASPTGEQSILFSLLNSGRDLVLALDFIKDHGIEWMSEKDRKAFLFQPKIAYLEPDNQAAYAELITIGVSAYPSQMWDQMPSGIYKAIAEETIDFVEMGHPRYNMKIIEALKTMMEKGVEVPEYLLNGDKNSLIAIANAQWKEEQSLQAIAAETGSMRKKHSNAIRSPRRT